MMRPQLTDTPNAVSTPGHAWVVLSVSTRANPEYYKELEKLREQLKKIELSDVEFEEIYGPARINLLEKTGGIIQVKRQEAAFTSYHAAKTLSGYLEDSEGPVLLDTINVEVPIDRFVAEITEGKRPYTVLLIDGSLFEVWGYTSPDSNEVSSIDDPSYGLSDDGSYHFSGTFWANNCYEARILAQEYWESLGLSPANDSE